MVMEPREYQSKIFETAKDFNTLVVLPTGTGKTLVAFLLAKHRLESFPSSKILFLAPTKPLVEQHYDYFKANLPELYAELQMFTGKIGAKAREKIWPKADIIFSTPQCIANDLKRRRIDLSEVSLLIEDEAHRCTKNYDYTYVAKKYLETSKNPRIIGMTASPGSDQQTISDICECLGIEKIESRDRESADVQPYLQELSVEIVYVDLPPELCEIGVLLKEMYDKKIDELRNRRLLFGPPSKKNLLLLQHKLGGMASSGNSHFNVLKGLSVCAQAIKLSHAIELAETQGITPLRRYFQNLFEQANNNQSNAVKQIVKNPLFGKAYTEVIRLEGKIEHPKFDRLKELVKEEILKNPKSRFIIFSQYRDMASLITNELNKIPEIKSRLFIGQLKKNDIGLSQKEQRIIIEQFRNGDINTLTSTSIGEEGLDLPEVNIVIFYEPIPSAIRKIQRQGRTARLKPGKLITLMTKGTRDETNYWTAFHKEKKMKKIISNMQEDFERARKEGLSSMPETSEVSERKKQKSIDEFKSDSVLSN